MSVDFCFDVDFDFGAKSWSTEVYLPMSISFLSHIRFYYWKIEASSTGKSKPKRSWIWSSVCALFKIEVIKKTKLPIKQKSTLTEVYSTVFVIFWIPKSAVAAVAKCTKMPRITRVVNRRSQRWNGGVYFSPFFECCDWAASGVIITEKSDLWFVLCHCQVLLMRLG